MEAALGSLLSHHLFRQGNPEPGAQDSLHVTFVNIQGWKLHTFLGSLGQGKVFLTCRGTVLHFRLCPWPLVLPPGTTGKNQSLSSTLPLRYLYTWMKIPLTFLCSGRHNPKSHSLSLYERCSSHFFLGPFTGLPPPCPCLQDLLLGALHWTQHSKGGLTGASMTSWYLVTTPPVQPRVSFTCFALRRQ